MEDLKILTDSETRHAQALLFEHLVLYGSENMEKLFEKYKDILNLEITIATDHLCTCAKKFENVPYDTSLLSEIQDGPDEVKTIFESIIENIKSGFCRCHTAGTDILLDCKPSFNLMHIACGIGDLNVVKSLVKYGCGLDHRTAILQTTPLHVAIKNHRVDIVKYLLFMGVDVNVQSLPEMHTPLAVAMIHRYKDIIECLLKVKNIDLEMTNSNNECPLILAMHLVEEEIFSMLLDAGANPNIVDDRGNTALMLGTIRGTFYVQKLISKAVDLNARNRRQETALFFATYIENEEIVEMLLKAGADMNISANDGTTALLTACYQGSTKIVKILVDYHADIKASNPQRYSSIHIAAWNGYYDIVQILLKAGVHHDTPTRDGNTPLALAAHGCHQRVMDILLPLGCDINNADKDKDTALHYAAYNNMTEGVRKLIEYGADPNCQNSYKATPLWNAVYMKNKNIVKILLNANVRMEVPSVGINQQSQSDTAVRIYTEEKSPLYVAVDRGYFDIFLLLIASGYNLHSEAWVFNDDLYPKENIDTNIQSLLKKFAAEPPRLIAICRNYYRRSLGQAINDKVRHLELPVTLQNYLLLGDVLS